MQRCAGRTQPTCLLRPSVPPGSKACGRSGFDHRRTILPGRPPASCSTDRTGPPPTDGGKTGSERASAPSSRGVVVHESLKQSVQRHETRHGAIAVDPLLLEVAELGNLGLEESPLGFRI